MLWIIAAGTVTVTVTITITSTFVNATTVPNNTRSGAWTGDWDYDAWEQPRKLRPPLPTRTELFRNLGVRVKVPWPCRVRQFSER